MQAATEVCPGSAVVTPGGQGEQLAAPAEAMYEPAAQGEQAAAPAPAAKDPGGHAAQPAALSVPALVTAPAKPCAQAVHAATETLPTCRPPVVTPGGQAVQRAAPAAEYAPGGHGAHAEAPAAAA